MNKHSMIFIGLDTHKEFNEVAYCEQQRGAAPVHYGRIPSSEVSVKKSSVASSLNILDTPFSLFMMLVPVAIGFTASSPASANE